MSASAWAQAISGLSLAVAIVSLVTAMRANSRQAGLQARILEIETARESDRTQNTRRAALVACIASFGRTDKLMIRNGGASVARNVRVLLDAGPLLEHCLVPSNQSEASTIGPGAAVEYVLAPSMDSPDVFHVALTWEDDTGSDGRWESDLRI